MNIFNDHFLALGSAAFVAAGGLFAATYRSVEFARLAAAALWPALPAY